ncbi:adenine phosphoribosyltransferase [bacterium]|nr:adenine phosphoribosyltransferase [bacterium]
MDIASKLRTIPDFPKPGIQFKDITPLLGDPAAFNAVIFGIAERYHAAGLTKIVGIESRGFIFGAALAHALGLGFVPVRKAGKLPADVFTESYALEYGEATVELHKDALSADDRVLIVDDLLATGGTLEAAAKLVQKSGAQIAGMWLLIELAFLKGRDRLKDFEIHCEVVIDD